jgi:hypothetical protein
MAAKTTSKVEAGHPSADARVRQVAHLAAFQRRHCSEFTDVGRDTIQRAMLALVMDCRLAGIDGALIEAAVYQATVDATNEAELKAAG